MRSFTECLKKYNLNTIYISERLQALAAYSNAINYDAALAVIQKDAGILLASLSPGKDSCIIQRPYVIHCQLSLLPAGL